MSMRASILVCLALSLAPLTAQDAPPPPTPEEAKIAGDLVRRAREAIGPLRDGETAAACDARNRGAIALLWDARWIRRAEDGFSIEADLEAAGRHVARPVFGSAAFRSPQPLPSATFWRSAKGPRLVAGTESGRIAIWDVATGARLVEAGTEVGQPAVFVAAAGETVVAALKDGQIFAVDPETGRERWRHRAAKRIFPVAIAVHSGADRAEVRVLLYDALLRLDAATGAELETVPLADLEPLDASFSADGSVVLAYGTKGVARVLRLGDPPREIRSIELETIDSNTRFGIVMSPHAGRRAALSPGGQRAAVTRAAGGVAVVEVESGREIATAPGEPGRSMGLAFEGEERLVIRSPERIRVLDLRTGKVESDFSLTPFADWVLGVPGDGIYAGAYGEWRVLDPASGRLLRGPAGDGPAPVVHLVRRANGLLVSGGWTTLGNQQGLFGRKTALIDPSRWTAIRAWDDLVVLDVDAAGKLAAGIAGDEYRIVSLESGETTLRVPFHSPGDDRTMAVPAAALTPDGREVFLSLVGGGCARHEVGSGKILATLGAGDPPSPIQGLLLHPDGRLLAAGTVIQHRSQTILFDLSASKVYGLGPLMNMNGRTAFAFSPDGRWVVSSQAGVHVLDLQDPAEPRRVGRGLPPEVREDRGPESIRALAFSPDGRHLATVDAASRRPWGLGTRDTLVRVFEVGSWKLVARYGVGPAATAIAWHEDGRRAWIGHADGTISELLLLR